MKRYTTVLLAVLFVVLALDASAGSSRRRAASAPEEISGVITAVSADRITIMTRRGSREARLNASTVVTVDGRRAAPDVLLAGDSVEARLRKETDGTFTAVSVEVETGDTAGGIIKSVSSGSLTIQTRHGDLTFTLTPSTAILIHDRRVSATALAVGMKVEVEWLRGAGTTHTALVVEVKAEFSEVEGVVTAVTSDSMTIRTGKGDVTVHLTSDTSVRSHGRLTTAGSVRTGSRVEVKALRAADGGLSAVFIELQNETDLIEVKGTVTAVSAGSIKVRTRSGEEVTVAVTSKTIVRSDDRRVSISDVHVGDVVEIEALPAGSGLEAVAIKVEDEDDEFTEIEGTIRQIAGSVLTIERSGGRTVIVSVTSRTVIRRDDANASVADLKVGDRVEIVAHRNSDGSLEATFMEIEGKDDDDDDDQLVEFEGTITAVSATSLTMATEHRSVTVAIDASTVIRKDDRRGAVADLAVGMKVEVKARRNAGGTYLATVIKIDN